MRRPTLALLSAAALSAAAALSLPAADAPAPAAAAGNPSRNVVSAERNLPESVEVGKPDDATGEVDLKKT
ncbi:MAG TPA: hypothetical protein VF796_04840 [Humisphaera sp.]